MCKSGSKCGKNRCCAKLLLLKERYSLRNSVSEQDTYSYIVIKQTSTVLQCERGNNPCGGVGQDKRASTCERVASSQPAPPKNMTRARHMNIFFLRSQKNFNDVFLTDISSVSFTHSLAWFHMSYPAPDALSP